MRGVPRAVADRDDEPSRCRLAAERREPALRKRDDPFGRSVGAKHAKPGGRRRLFRQDDPAVGEKSGPARNVGRARSESRPFDARSSVAEPGRLVPVRDRDDPVACPVGDDEEEAAGGAVEPARPAQGFRRDVELENLDPRGLGEGPGLHVRAEEAVVDEEAPDVRVLRQSAGGERASAGDVVDREDPILDRGEARPVRRKDEERGVARKEEPGALRLRVSGVQLQRHRLQRTAVRPAFDPGRVLAVPGDDGA